VNLLASAMADPGFDLRGRGWTLSMGGGGQKKVIESVYG